MTFSKDSAFVINRMFRQITDNRSFLFLHFIVHVNSIEPDIKISKSSNIVTSSCEFSGVSFCCPLSGNPLASFNGELYKISGSLNLKLLISSWKYMSKSWYMNKSTKTHMYRNIPMKLSGSHCQIKKLQSSTP
jgi:hypothetical protein